MLSWGHIWGQVKKKKDNTNTIGPISLTADDRNSTADDRIPILRV